MAWSHIWLTLFIVLVIALVVRVLAVDGKEPESRAAWIVVLLFLPGIGVAAYLLFGEAWIPPKLRRRALAVDADLSDAAHALPPSERDRDKIPDRFQSVFRACEAITGGYVAGRNTATLARDSNAAIDDMVADFDAARETIHVSFYIWLPDRNGMKVIEALKRAAARGVTCRAIADGIGSRSLIGSEHWQAMADAGVRLCVSMKVARGLAIVFGSRMDLRNHRKIVVVDNHITYSGSQNCADPEFQVKAKYAPWVDIMLRMEGPVALQNQCIFAGDWMIEEGEDLTELTRAEPDLTATTVPPNADVPAIAFGTGPVSAPGAMSTIFVNLLFCARDEVVISNPYFVPDPHLLSALEACARRGVDTTLILPARNDSRVVRMISKAYYPLLIEAGVKIHEYHGGLLHAKTLVADGAVALVGSANMDRRSLELNFENNVLLHSTAFVTQIRQRQDEWLADSTAVDPERVYHRPLLRRMGKHLATIFSPIM